MPKPGDSITSTNLSVALAATSQSGPYVEIVEQPCSAIRFRYECEKGSGTVMGAKSSTSNKKYPAIRVRNYQGNFVVVLSLVTNDDKPKPHPHVLVGEECKEDVLTKKVKDSRDGFVEFKSLGIQCVKKKEVEESLNKREKLRIDPFRTGFSHKFSPNEIDLTVVRLCFQVFLPDETGRYQRPVKAVCSVPIADKKSATNLEIESFVPVSCSVKGGDCMILLTGKLNSKKSLEVVFIHNSETRANEQDWEEPLKIDAKDIHNSCAIKIKIPAYGGQPSKLKKIPCHIYIREEGNPTERGSSHEFLYLNEGCLSGGAVRKRKVVGTEPGTGGKQLKIDQSSEENLPEVLESLQSNGSSLDPRSLSSSESLMSHSSAQSGALYAASSAVPSAAPSAGPSAAAAAGSIVSHYTPVTQCDRQGNQQLPYQTQPTGNPTMVTRTAIDPKQSPQRGVAQTHYVTSPGLGPFMHTQSTPVHQTGNQAKFPPQNSPSGLTQQMYQMELKTPPSVSYNEPQFTARTEQQMLQGNPDQQQAVPLYQLEDSNSQFNMMNYWCDYGGLPHHQGLAGEINFDGLSESADYEQMRLGSFSSAENAVLEDVLNMEGSNTVQINLNQN